VGSLFQQHIRTIPAITAAHWSFSIGGAVRHPLILTFDDLRAYPSVEWPCALACAARSPLIGHANWRGVPLAALLAELDFAPAIQHARIYSADGYHASLTLERLGGALLAYEMDGAPLPPEHGFPARLIAPGLYGYKMPKWVTHIRLGDAPAPGYWEARGWPDDGAARPLASIEATQAQVNGDILISGVAYAGQEAITGVEVSVDDGDWTPVTFTVEQDWVRWQAAWTPGAANGDVVLRARARTHSQLSRPHTVILRIVQERV
jgi:hypothetical protein